MNDNHELALDTTEARVTTPTPMTYLSKKKVLRIEVCTIWALRQNSFDEGFGLITVSRWFAILGPFPAATIDFSNLFPTYLENVPTRIQNFQ